MIKVGRIRAMEMLLNEGNPYNLSAFSNQELADLWNRWHTQDKHIEIINDGKLLKKEEEVDMKMKSYENQVKASEE